jgi:prepilin-type N-terminal cleavage/methylation domain-containing protein
MRANEARADGTEAGFSLVEVVVAMMLLALLALATLPALLTGVRSTAISSSGTSATAAMSAVIEQARATVTEATSGACSKLQQYAAAVPSRVFRDAQGRSMPLTMSAPDCSALPRAVTVTVTVSQPASVCHATSSSGCVLSTSTKIYVPS